VVEDAPIDPSPIDPSPSPIYPSMISPSPIARSPIAPRAPVEVRGGWEVSLASTDAALWLSDLTPQAKVLVRAARDGAVAASLACPPGRAVRSPAGDLVVRAGPDEWFVLGRPGSAEAIASRCAVADQSLVTVVDVTHLYVLLRLSGDAAPDLLHKLCAVNLSDAAAPEGTSFRSAVARVLTLVVRDDHDGVRSYLLQSDRSSAQYLFDILLDAGEEFGIGVSG
jgi:heterotetrameric sarcosine oxidase gamma subunit